MWKDTGGGSGGGTCPPGTSLKKIRGGRKIGEKDKEKEGKIKKYSKIAHRQLEMGQTRRVFEGVTPFNPIFFHPRPRQNFRASAASGESTSYILFNLLDIFPLLVLFQRFFFLYSFLLGGSSKTKIDYLRMNGTDTIRTRCDQAEWIRSL